MHQDKTRGAECLKAGECWVGTCLPTGACRACEEIGDAATRSDAGPDGACPGLSLGKEGLGRRRVNPCKGTIPAAA